jgi:hypothetical protein
VALPGVGVGVAVPGLDAGVGTALGPETLDWLEVELISPVSVAGCTFTQAMANPTNRTPAAGVNFKG